MDGLLPRTVTLSPSGVIYEALRQDRNLQRQTMTTDTPPEDDKDSGQDKYIVPGLERGLRLLGEFSSRERTLSAAELARRLKVPRSTVFRLLATLEMMGFVERTDGGREDRVHAVGAKRRRQPAAERRRVLGILKDERRLQIKVGVQTGRQAEVAAHQSARLLVEGQCLAFVQCRHGPILCQTGRRFADTGPSGTPTCPDP